MNNAHTSICRIKYNVGLFLFAIKFMIFLPNNLFFEAVENGVEKYFKLCQKMQKLLQSILDCV